MVLAVLFSFVTKAGAQNEYKDIPSSASTPGVYYLGNCLYTEPNSDYSLGLDADATLQVFSRVARSKMRKFKDSKVVGVRVAVTDQIEAKVFIKQEINTDILVSKTLMLFPGWNEVYFDTPYDIIDKSLCFGYEHKVKSSGSEVPQYNPVYALDGQKETATSDGFYWQVNDKSPESFAKKFGNLMVQLIISDPPSFTQNHGSLEFLMMPKVKEEDGTSTFKVGMRNIGSNPIDKYTLTYKLNDVEAGEVEVTGELPEQYLRVLTVKGVKAEKGDVLTVNIKSLNGTDYTEDAGLTGLFDMAEKSFPKKVLLEHFTTEKCGNCPGRDKVMHMIIDGRYKDDFVWTAHHVGFYTDFLSLEDSEDLLFMYGEDGTFCPAMSLNRQTLFDDVVNPVISIPVDEEFIEMMLLSSLAVPAPLGITVKADYNKETNEITAEVFGEIEPNDVDADNCVLNVWVVEDKIKPEHQAGVKEGEFFEHNNVIRYMHNGAAGEELIIDKFDKFSEKVVIPYDDAWNYDNVRVVAFVSRPIDDPDYDIRVYNSDDVRLSEHQGIEQIGADSDFRFQAVGGQILANGVSSNEVKVYTMDGTLVPNCDLKPGVYAARAKNSPVQKVVVK